MIRRDDEWFGVWGPKQTDLNILARKQTNTHTNKRANKWTDQPTNKQTNNK